MFSVIETIKDKCRRCYTCVRSCPVKAIRIVDGQASVVQERCIACGRCITGCSRNAKTYASGIEQTLALLNDGQPVAALLAPSYVAEFDMPEPERIFTALRAVGFRYVVEVARGADVVSVAYAELLHRDPEGLWIATTCPAIVERVRKYHPSLTNRLAPVVSPMIASALEVRKIYGENTHCIFIGPCIAKKVEARDPLLPRVVDEALTFVELRRIFEQKGIHMEQMAPSEPDPPHAGIGCSFPLTGGLLISAGLEKDPLDNRFMVATGRRETDEALIDMEENRIRLSLLEALMCHGCHAGPGMSRVGSSHRQRALICAYAQKARQVQLEAMDVDMEVMAKPPALPDTRAFCPHFSEHAGGTPRASMSFAITSMERGFVTDDQRLAEPNEDDIRNILAHTNKFSPEDELNCGACGYSTCRAKAAAVFHELAEEAMCLPFLIDQAERVCNELRLPWKDFREIHRQLVSNEKLASLGQLAAGIAHELNNPLGTILLYAGLIERKLGGESKVSGDIDLVQKETQRCKRIVAGLLDFARQNRLRFTRSRMDTYIEEVVSNSFNTEALASKGVRLRFEAGEESVEADVDRDQLMQVLVNIIQNGIDALGERGGEVVATSGYSEDRNRIRITVRDTGCGIPPEDHDRVFQPFFTTKNIGKGTGLGLAIAYGIVKIHQGTIWFESAPGTGTTFFIELPLVQARQLGSVPL